MDNLQSKCHHEQITSDPPIFPESVEIFAVLKLLIEPDLFLERANNSRSRLGISSATMSLESLPFEILLLICNNLDAAGLNVLTRTCSRISRLLDRLLYQQAVKSDGYKHKFLYAVIYGQTNAVFKFLKAGVLMSAFEDCEQGGYWFAHGGSASEMKRHAWRYNFHPLLAAAYFGNVDVIVLLLNEGNVNIDCYDCYGKTALHYAIESDRFDIIKLLLEQGARIGDYHKKQSVQSPFIHAAEFGNRNAVRLMFNTLQLRNRGNQLELCGPQKAIFDESIKSQCEKACYEACRKDYFDIVEFFLYQGTDVNASVNQRRLLYWVPIEGGTRLVELLVKYRARMESERDCGIVTLLSRNGDWHDDHEGRNRNPSMDRVMYLLRSGCNVANGGIHACALWALAQYSGSKGHRWYATSREREEIMTHLLKNGFDKKKCKHGCFKRKGKTSLISKMRRQGLEEYVEEQELREGKW